MGTECYSSRTVKRDKVLSGEAEKVTKINPRVKSKLKLFCLEELTKMSLDEVLYDCGLFNMQIKDIAVMLGIKPIELQTMLDNGKKDLEDGLLTKESKLYSNYISGLKSLEGNAVVSMMKKAPEKLLSVLNPEVYSDNIADKYEIPNINIVFGNDAKVNLEELENEIVKQCVEEGINE